MSEQPNNSEEPGKTEEPEAIEMAESLSQQKKLAARKIGLIAAVIVVAAIAIGVWVVSYQIPHSEAESEFNAAVAGLNERNAELDDSIAALHELMGSEPGPLDPTTLDAASAAIGEAQGARSDAPKMPSGTEEIRVLAAEVEGMGDYTAQIASLAEAQANLQNSIDQLKQVTNPTEQFVIERITGLPNISGVEAVTENNDPNGNLNKQSGYTATVYFSSDLVNQDEVWPSEGYTGIPALGTDAGGAVEVYATVEDAEERDAYLGAFDGGMLSTGSHTVVGTCVVRTSDYLTASQQKDIEAAVIESLTRLE